MSEVLDGSNVNTERVLVTGGNGYVAGHVIKQLLGLNYKVRTTIRSLSDEKKLEQVKSLCENDEIEVYEAVLENSLQWLEAVKNCDYVIHIAWPMPTTPPNFDFTMVETAKKGLINVLNACVQEGTIVRRFVLTSSLTAICGDEVINGKVYTEEDWPQYDNLHAYSKSKVAGERLAWDFIKERQMNKLSCFELTTVHPAFILGPILTDHVSQSVELLKRIMMREFPMLVLSDAFMPTCDVRDVALAHIKAMQKPEAVNQRHIVVSTYESPSLLKWAQLLREEFGDRYPITLQVMPNIFFKVLAFFEKTTRAVIKFIQILFFTLNQ